MGKEVEKWERIFQAGEILSQDTERYENGATKGNKFPRN